MKKLLLILIFMFAMSGCDVIEGNDVPECEEGYILDENNDCIIEEEPVQCEEGYILDENEQCVEEIDQVALNEFLTNMSNFEDILAFSSYLEISERTDLRITNNQEVVLSESSSNVYMMIDSVNRFVHISTDINGFTVETMQVFEHDAGLVQISYTEDSYTTYVQETGSINDIIGTSTNSEDISDKSVKMIEKTDELIFLVTYTKSDFFTDEELNLLLGEGSGYNHDNVEEVVVTFDFTNINDKKMNMSITIADIIYQEDYQATITIQSDMGIPEEMDLEIMMPNENHIIEPAKSLDEVFLIFKPDQMVRFNQTDGDNIIAVELPPGDYVVFSDYYANQTNSPYLITYNEDKEEFQRNSFIHIDEETIIYFNFASYGGWTQDDRRMVISPVEVLHDGESDYTNINGTITIDFTEIQPSKNLIFPDATFDGIIIFESVVMNEENQLLMISNTRCENMGPEQVCAIKTYEGSTMTIHITSFIADSVTMTYRIAEYDEISTDQSNPTPIHDIENGLSLESDTSYFVSFESTGDTYIFDLKSLHPGYYLSSTSTLYDSEGNLVANSFGNAIYLEQGTYVVEFTAWGFHSAALPVVQIVE